MVTKLKLWYAKIGNMGYLAGISNDQSKWKSHKTLQEVKNRARREGRELIKL